MGAVMGATRGRISSGSGINVLRAAPPITHRSEAPLGRMAQLTQALLDEEVHVPEPGKPGWPDHPALTPKFGMRVMPDA